MDIPKLQPITNKLKTNASAAGNASKGGGGDAAGTSHVGNNHFNKSGAGYGLNYNANDTSNQFPIGDRRYNYNGTGRRDFITDRRKDQHHRNNSYNSIRVSPTSTLKRQGYNESNKYPL
ncbi:uncharacterized protein [Eurosta solidaginis]|uniref:uncharacterized protein isoform X3 n=1 Tax=Eurosta solidaginis TaxID=178769 RepID=UPI0035308EF0